MESQILGSSIDQNFHKTAIETGLEIMGAEFIKRVRYRKGFYSMNDSFTVGWAGSPHKCAVVFGREGLKKEHPTSNIQHRIHQRRTSLECDKMKKQTYDREERLLEYSVRIIKIVERRPNKGRPIAGPP